ncbi:MAG: efflux RND transporter periplasmic adaptor subunit [Proteobacteria bacterium]|nr:efflux RND transporter periplasmic adaptor subunit [Pseudomonadota bacterium]MBU1710231.1 efflux RND transporter periplasmic adaptor subunit [Pseudomonadota bacterium]
MRCIVQKIIILLSAISLFFSATVLAQDPPPAKVVTTNIILKEIAENRSFIGLLYYERISHVSSEVSGLVESIQVREGDHVKKGSALVHLNTEMLDKEITIQQTRIKQIELRIEQTAKNHKRLDGLYRQNGVSEKEYDDTFYAYQDAIIEKSTAEETLGKLLIQKRKSIINAPFDGVVLEKSVDIGDWVQQGKQLVRLACTDDLFVRVPVAENLLQYSSVGDEVTVMINAYKKEVAGKIFDIDPTADAKTKNIFLKIKIPVIEKIAENMSATVFVPTSSKRKLAIIPRDALIKFQGSDFVYSIKDGKAAILPVNIVSYLNGTIGADNPYFEPGMPVVIEGNERLRPDQSVIVVGE